MGYIQRVVSLVRRARGNSSSPLQSHSSLSLFRLSLSLSVLFSRQYARIVECGSGFSCGMQQWQASIPCLEIGTVCTPSDRNNTTVPRRSLLHSFLSTLARRLRSPLGHVACQCARAFLLSRLLAFFDCSRTPKLHCVFFD